MKITFSLCVAELETTEEEIIAYVSCSNENPIHFKDLTPEDLVSCCKKH